MNNKLAVIIASASLLVSAVSTFGLWKIQSDASAQAAARRTAARATIISNCQRVNTLSVIQRDVLVSQFVLSAEQLSHFTPVEQKELKSIFAALSVGNGMLTKAQHDRLFFLIKKLGLDGKDVHNAIDKRLQGIVKLAPVDCNKTLAAVQLK